MKTQNRLIFFASRTVALSALLGVGMVAAQAQSAATEPKLNLQMPAQSQDAMFSSSSAANETAVAENHFDFVAAAKDHAQPPSRRYGRPRYRGGNTNADGSNKWAFMADAGLTQPVSTTHDTLNPSWGFGVGGGRNFNKTFGVLVQFDYDNFGFNGNTLGNQLALYNRIISIFDTQNGLSPGNPNYVPALPGLDGNTHVMSLTLNPTYTFYSGEGLGAYVVGGVGFYHKVADFTTPTLSVACDAFGCYQYQANQIIDHYTSNAPGYNGGFGITYKTSRFSNSHLFAEARYVYIPNSQRTGITLSTVNTTNYLATNDFPANSNHTSYMPIKVGIRF